MLHHYTYLHANSTEWVTFVHGAGGSSSIWFKQIKAFKEHYNVLMVDLRGHGKSKFPLAKGQLKKYTFNYISKDIIEVLDHLKIGKSHFIGISLGTIIIRELAEKYSNRVQSMVMGGAIVKLNIRSQILMRLGFMLKSIMPYLLLYKLFAFVIMPRKKHKSSRNLFINEAKKLYQKEFIRWFKLTSEVNPLLKWFRAKDPNIATLYVMGSEDYMFLPTVKMLVNEHQSSSLQVINNCGHVVNVDAPNEFNTRVLSFLSKLT